MSISFQRKINKFIQVLYQQHPLINLAKTTLKKQSNIISTFHLKQVLVERSIYRRVKQN